MFEGWSGDAVSVEVDTGQLKGEWRPATAEARDSEPRLDFRPPVELCHCCGQELLSSGSRWSDWFCAECKPRVQALNARAGVCVIPIGRHSLMNGIAIKLRDVDSDIELERLTARIRKMSANIDRLHDWKREIVRRNCAESGLLGRHTISLAEYLQRVRDAKISRSQAFFSMLESSDGDAPG